MKIFIRARSEHDERDPARFGTMSQKRPRWRYDEQRWRNLVRFGTIWMKSRSVIPLGVLAGFLQNSSRAKPQTNRRDSPYKLFLKSIVLHQTTKSRRRQRCLVSWCRSAAQTYQYKPITVMCHVSVCVRQSSLNDCKHQQLFRNNVVVADRQSPMKMIKIKTNGRRWRLVGFVSNGRTSWGKSCGSTSNDATQPERQKPNHWSSSLHTCSVDSSSTKNMNHYTWHHHQQDIPGHENTNIGRRNRKIKFRCNRIDPHDGHVEKSARDVSRRN